MTEPKKMSTQEERRQLQVLSQLCGGPPPMKISTNDMSEFLKPQTSMIDIPSVPKWDIFPRDETFIGSLKMKFL